MRRKVLLVICVLSALVFLGSAGVLLHYWQQDRSDQKVRESLWILRPADSAPASDAPEAEATPDTEAFAQLLALNPDTIGWLRIDGTTIDDVVMYAPQEKEKYLHRDFYGNDSVRGAFFVDENCDVRTSDNLIIYGHHMKDGTMFGALADYQDADFAARHPYIRFHSLYGSHTYEVVAAINTRILAVGEPGFRYYAYTGSGDDEMMQEYWAFIQSNRLYDTGVSIQPGDRLITLSTCAYHAQDGRFIVVAKRID